MIVTIDCNTSPREMHHLAVALQRIAAESGYVSSKTNTPVGEMYIKVDIDTTDITTAIDTLAAHAAANNVSVEVLPPVSVSVGEIVNVTTGVGTVVHESELNAGHDANLDINGLPWDARIHAGSRERNTDRSWRVRRRPKGVEEAEWDATLGRVTAELTDLMAIPVSPGAVAEEALTDAEVDEFVNIIEGVVEPTVVEGAGSYTEVEGSVPPPTTTVGDAVAALNAVAPPVTIAPPVVVPPVTAVAPPITVDKPAIETFAQLMTWLTSRTPKDEAAKPAMVTRVNEILAANGLTTLQQLGQRADLIPQVLVQFQAAFGE